MAQTTRNEHALDLNHFLYYPTSEWRVPLDRLVVAATRYVGSVQQHGCYRFCIAWLRERSIARLAEKLYLDDQITIPAPTIDNNDLRATLGAPLLVLWGRYFVSIGPPAWPINHCDCRLAPGG